MDLGHSVGLRLNPTTLNPERLSKVGKMENGVEKRYCFSQAAGPHRCFLFGGSRGSRLLLRQG